jgi:hypothetical protein
MILILLESPNCSEQIKEMFVLMEVPHHFSVHFNSVSSFLVSKFERLKQITY